MIKASSISLLLFIVIACGTSHIKSTVVTEMETYDPTDTTKLDILNLDNLENDTSFVPPKAIKVVHPEVDSEFEKNYSKSEADIKVLITSNGTVKRAIVYKSDNTDFNRPALVAALQWKWQPATKNGIPATIWALITFKYPIKK